MENVNNKKKAEMKVEEAGGRSSKRSYKKVKKPRRKLMKMGQK